jgi:glycosyltransferase involved in cell wall biosynthesis
MEQRDFMEPNTELSTVEARPLIQRLHKLGDIPAPDSILPNVRARLGLKDMSSISQVLISVIIPVRNEAQNLQYVLPHIPAIVSEVILVDGHSTDDTVAVAQKLRPDIRVIKQPGKGRGDALRAGFAASRGNVIVMLDGDGSVDPHEIPRFAEALLAGNDFVKGSRFIQGGGSRHVTPLRLLGSYAMNTLVNILFRTRITDLCHGYNAFWRHHLDQINFDSDGFEFNTLITLRAHLVNLKIVEIPCFERPRIHGANNFRTFRDGWRVLKAIIKERSRSIASRTQSPSPYHTISDKAVPSIRGTVFIESWKNKSRTTIQDKIAVL